MRPNAIEVCFQSRYLPSVTAGCRSELFVFRDLVPHANMLLPHPLHLTSVAANFVPVFASKAALYTLSKFGPFYSQDKTLAAIAHRED